MQHVFADIERDNAANLGVTPDYTCPCCRTFIRSTPAPNLVIRSLVSLFLSAKTEDEEIQMTGVGHQETMEAYGARLFSEYFSPLFSPATPAA